MGTEQQEANQSNTAGAGAGAAEEGNWNPRPSTSRGTQRLYIRLNTLHYLTKHLHSLEKTLSLSPKVTPSKSRRRRHSYFEHTRSAIQAAQQHVAEVAAYRLVFLDSSSVLYGSLYNPDVGAARIRPALRVMKQNLTLLCAIVTEHVQGAAVRHVMAACFEAYLMVLLAGGSSRIFYRADHAMIEEDFEGLRGLFGEGLDEVAGAEAVEGVVALMEQTTEQLVEDLSVLAGAGVAGQKMAMPPTTGKWSRTDPNTILRVLCHRNDRAANSFLKRTFHLAKRNGSL